jgi:hypothetical protein
MPKTEPEIGEKIKSPLSERVFYKPSLKGITEQKTAEEMCWLIHDWEKDKPPPPDSPKCQVLMASLYAAKTSLPKGSPRRVFVEDLAASLNRRRILKSEQYDEFQKLGFEYMEASV